MELLPRNVWVPQVVRYLEWEQLRRSVHTTIDWESFSMAPNELPWQTVYDFRVGQSTVEERGLSVDKANSYVKRLARITGKEARDKGFLWGGTGRNVWTLDVGWTEYDDVIERLKRSYTNSGKKRQGISLKTRHQVFERDGFRCCDCGASPQRDGVVLHVDHKIAVANGGSNELNNLRTLCRDCNAGKSARIVSYPEGHL